MREFLFNSVKVIRHFEQYEKNYVLVGSRLRVRRTLFQTKLYVRHIAFFLQISLPIHLSLGPDYYGIHQWVPAFSSSH